MAIFAYADETTFKRDKANKSSTLGCAILMCEEEIKQELINDAMASIKGIVAANRDVARIVDKTLERGYFHSSEDSNIAREIFLKTINRHLKGKIAVTYFDNWAKDSEKRKNQKLFFDRSLSSSSIKFFNNINEINLTIEHRNGISQQSTAEWKKSIYSQLENTAFNLPSYITYFPKISIEIKNKENPGLQVTDTLLWSINKFRSIPSDNKWLKFLRISLSSFEEPNGTNSNHTAQYYINSAPEKWNDYPFEYRDSETNEDLYRAYNHIERFLRTIEKTDFSEKNIHLYEDFSKASNMLCEKTYHLTRDDLEKIGRVYIRLFDSLPIYSLNHNEAKWEVLFHTKHIASLLLSQGFMHVERTKSAILRWRYKLQQSGELEAVISKNSEL